MFAKAFFIKLKQNNNFTITQISTLFAVFLPDLKSFHYCKAYLKVQDNANRMHEKKYPAKQVLKGKTLKSTYAN